MYINRTERDALINSKEQAQRVKKNSASGDFSQALGEVIGVDAVELSRSTDDATDQQKQKRQKRSLNPDAPLADKIDIEA